MASTETDDFVPTGANPSYNDDYSKTGLQTNDKSPERQSEHQGDDHDEELGPEHTKQTNHKREDGRNEREVTDPVTHVPITIYDATGAELEQIPPPPGTPQKQTQSEEEMKKDSDERHVGMNNLVADETDNAWVDIERREARSKIRAAIVAGGAGVLAGWIVLCWSALFGLGGGGVVWWFAKMVLNTFFCLVIGAGMAGAVWVFGGSGVETDKQVVPTSQTAPRKDISKEPESAAWLNSLLSSIWPIINPSLFVSITDMLEDVMQASLPKMITNVRVADFGQGQEALRILGVRWLEAGDAPKEKQGMPGEEGEFVNFEMAVAYRARPTKKSAPGGGLKGRSKNAHIMLEFFTHGGVKLPVWAEVKGFLATLRIRLQLTPNPPFLSVATITFLGQPKVDISCVPLAKNFFNIMDLPIVDNYLQSCINQATEMYVAPRSLQLDLMTMLTGKPKMDVDALGVLYIRIISASDFKDGDAGKQWLPASHRRGDPYVTVGWGKYGKAAATTRILNNEGDPIWDETHFMLVSPADVDADETLKLQLWDSDRNTADDLLGVVEIDLKELMNSEESNGRICEREDDFKDYEGKGTPGRLRWDIGFFEKNRVGDYFASPDEAEQTKRKIQEEAEAKLREADPTSQESEIEQQKKEDLKERSNEIISGQPPSDDWHCGILYMKIQQITGLEVEHIKESGIRDEPEQESGEDLPSAYCTIIFNHQRIYKTRTKMKDNKPFYDAGTERFIRDFKGASLMIAVHDERPHESDALLGVVVIPLPHIFAERSQITKAYPLVGGIGYGRLHFSLIFRAVHMSLPRELSGWDVGTFQIQPHARCSDLPDDLSSCRLVFRTLYAKRKLFPDSDNPGNWIRKDVDRPLHLAVRKRYATCLIIEFRKTSLGPDRSPAFATLWFKDVVDDEEKEFSLPVYRNADKALARATTNVVDNPAEKIGEISFTARFYPGLSGYHTKLASSDKDLAKVMQVLDAAEDAQEVNGGVGEDDDGSASSSDSSSDSEPEGDEKERDEHRGIVDEVRDYKKKKGDLHRRHRGLMQWSGARKVAWMTRGARERGHGVAEMVKGRFKGGNMKKDKIEKEV